MVGSIDCMHWMWKNCPYAWKGAFQGKEGAPTLVLEAVCDHRLWICHSFSGMAGSNNDLNVLDRSHLFTDLIRGESSRITFFINGNEYCHGYYLADGIYPDWVVFVKTISQPQGRKQRLFADLQEGLRKDIERCFGVLQQRFRI